MNPIDLAQRAGSNPWLFLGAALLLGAFHGLEPGHSKGIMAAFMVGTRGTYVQAIVLAVCATLSHTAIVWLLAIPTSYGGMLWSGTQLSPYLNLISGIVVLFLAYWMLRRFNRMQTGHTHNHRHSHGHEEHDHGEHADHDHNHDDGHDHLHDEEIDHGHHHHDDGHVHDHDHSLVEPNAGLATVMAMEDDEHARYHMREIASRFQGQTVSTPQVALFGLSTGLAPCSAAIVILITCFRLHQPWLGAALVAAFSVGLGLTLSSVALLASLGARTLGSRSPVFQQLVQKAPFLSALVTAGVGLYLLVQFFRSY